MVTLPMLVGMLIVQDPSLASAAAGRSSICVTASADTEPVAEVKDLADSVKDLERALRSLAVKRQLAVAGPGGSCGVKLLVQRRIEDEEEEKYTVVVRMSTSASGGASRSEELTATEGSWRGAASTIAGKVAAFVDGNRGAAAETPASSTASNGTASSNAPAASAPAAATPGPSASRTSSAPPPPAPPPLPPSAPASTQKATPRTSASSRTVEDGILDWVKLTDAGGHSMQTPVYMRLFTTDKADLGTGGDGGKETRASEAKTVQGQGPTLLRDTFMTKAKTVGLNASTAEEGATLPASAIVIEGEFVTIDPGSRAKRYFVGFGAGKSAIEIAGRIRTGDGTTIAEFKHRRIGAMGMGGGDSLGKLLSDTRSCGEDLAKFIEAFLGGKSLK